MLNIELMLEMGRRIQPDNNWWKPETLAFAKVAAMEAGYCIDAPDVFPAGSVAWEEFGDGFAGPLPTTADRETANGETA